MSFERLVFSENRVHLSQAHGCNYVVDCAVFKVGKGTSGCDQKCGCHFHDHCALQVSVDFRCTDVSTTIDASLTMVMGDDMVKVVSWYDNEWGYRCVSPPYTGSALREGFAVAV